MPLVLRKQQRLVSSKFIRFHKNVNKNASNLKGGFWTHFGHIYFLGVQLDTFRIICLRLLQAGNSFFLLRGLYRFLLCLGWHDLDVFELQEVEHRLEIAL